MARMRTILVKSGRKSQKDGGHPLALFDRHDAYEGGELFIADGREHDVPLTAAVRAALNTGALIEVGSIDDVEPFTDHDDVGDEDDEDEAQTIGGETFEQLLTHTREQLDAMAAELGVEDPGALANKNAVVEAMFDATFTNED